MAPPAPTVVIPAKLIATMTSGFSAKTSASDARAVTIPRTMKSFLFPYLFAKKATSAMRSVFMREKLVRMIPIVIRSSPTLLRKIP